MKGVIDKLIRWSVVLLEISVRKMMSDVGCDQNVIARTLRPLATVLCHDMAEAHLRNLERELSEIERTILLPTIRDTDDVEEKAKLIERVTAVTTFKNARLNQYHSLDIECYPEIFVDMFNGVPELPSEYIAKIKVSAEKFVPSMIALESGLALSDHELWVETFDRADIEPLFSL
ncbi:hypothetical protein [Marinobacterium rhizophilum]|uniref:hypothetical protein n=1 Tax=Marinobacterium rhizophilum TaxID=420402 RepID=UPI000364F7EE|nr:hypothetical protein [Marinobacterium rhizophilum]